MWMHPIGTWTANWKSWHDLIASKRILQDPPMPSLSESDSARIEGRDCTLRPCHASVAKGQVWSKYSSLRTVYRSRHLVKVTGFMKKIPDFRTIQGKKTKNDQAIMRLCLSQFHQVSIHFQFIISMMQPVSLKVGRCDHHRRPLISQIILCNHLSTLSTSRWVCPWQTLPISLKRAAPNLSLPVSAAARDAAHTPGEG